MSMASSARSKRAKAWTPATHEGWQEALRRNCQQQMLHNKQQLLWQLRSRAAGSGVRVSRRLCKQAT